MTRRQQLEAQMLVRAKEWADGRTADFTHTPTTAVDAKYNGARSKLSGAITELGGKAAIQAGGDFGEETEAQRVVRSDVEAALRNVNRTMGSVAENDERPEIMDRFRMPHGDNDETLRAKLRAFADAIDELSLGDELAGHGNTETAANLRTMADNFQTTEGEQGGALAGRAGATAIIPTVLRTGRAGVKTLNAIFHNVYKTNAELLTAWKTASRVQRSGGSGGTGGTGGGGTTPP